MEASAIIKCFLASSLPGASLSSVSLSFSPVRLFLLIAWVYLCLYVVQRIQFSKLVPKDRRAIASVAGLFLGPVLLAVLVIIDAIKKVPAGEGSFIEVLKERLQSAGRDIKSSLSRSPSESAIKLLDSSGRNIKEIYGHGKRGRPDSGILDLTEQIITDALEERASDILIDPKDELTYTLRFRVDGVLRTVQELEPAICRAVINSIKAVASMDIAEKRRPQDGAFVAKTLDGTTSFRVATAGVLNGEKVSVRVLNQNADMFTLANVGLSEKQSAVIESAIAKPSGMVLMCGPTGSGKTTTMYAMLNKIDLFTRNVITVEDPIEYVLPNASQIEINPKADITFAKSLRSILRQDPDVICVGEVRDEETAATALRASQTGHLVLATVHSDSNASALVRLLDLGVTPLLLSSGLNLVISQRLLRRLCSRCKVPAQLTQSQIHDFRKRGVNYKNIFHAKGCERCRDTGYYGRIAIFDILVLDNQLKTQIANNQLSVVHLKKDGEKKGKSNLRKQGLKKVVSGVTSLEELKRVAG